MCACGVMPNLLRDLTWHLEPMMGWNTHPSCRDHCEERGRDSCPRPERAGLEMGGCWKWPCSEQCCQRTSVMARIKWECRRPKISLYLGPHKNERGRPVYPFGRLIRSLAAKEPPVAQPWAKAPIWLLGVLLVTPLPAVDQAHNPRVSRWT